ncbi:MAG TPA: aminotransferase class V-fold PLP-dependent enzyme [Dehalococcoidia bacterium]|jgi:selenocysteine lyase/cysteine desulfurase
MANLAPRSDFELPEGLIHLAPGGEAPSLRSHRTVLDRYLACKGTGPAGQTARGEVVHAVRELAAELLGLPGAASIAFMPSVSDGMNALSHALPVRPGDNVVIEDREFGAVLYPWLHLERQGVEVRLVRQRDWEPAEGAFRAAIDGRTRAVAASQVSFLTGLHHNLDALSALAHAHGAWFVVDATHAAGAVPVPGPLCDFVLSASYKWLLGWHGVALLGWNRERVPDVEPAILGWKTPEAVPDRENPKAYVHSEDATRFEIGNPSYVGIFVLENALRYLRQIGIERIAEHDRRLSGMLNRSLRELGLDVATPLDAAYRAGNTCFWHSQPEALAAKLADDGVWVTGGDGRIRIGTHLWCSEVDVETALAALERALG